MAKEIPTQSSGTMPEKSLSEQFKELQEINQRLATQNYINNLQEDKLFRLELLQVLEKINETLTIKLQHLEQISKKFEDLALDGDEE